MKKRFAAIFLIATAALAIGLVLVNRNSQQQSFVCFRDNCFNVELALTPGEQKQGLMFREHLDFDKGMLFVFKEEGEYSFWMKNTLIPLDIIWINKDKEAVSISKNTQPCKADTCPVINPDRKARYVLELNGGIIDKIGLNIGDRFIFDLSSASFFFPILL